MNLKTMPYFKPVEDTSSSASDSANGDEAADKKLLKSPSYVDEAHQTAKVRHFIPYCQYNSWYQILQEHDTTQHADDSKN